MAKRSPAIDHQRLLASAPILQTDYSDYGGTVKRWAREKQAYPDCSMGCKWAAPLARPFSADWVVCTKPGAPRCGLLTFEHQAGFGCYEGPHD